MSLHNHFFCKKTSAKIMWPNQNIASKCSLEFS